jgi:hypothetical protein
MFSKIYTRWMAGAALTLALAANLLGTGMASAQTLSADLSVPSTTSTAQLTVEGDTAVAAGTLFTIQGASFEADEPVGFWINVPDGTTVPKDSLGQTGTHIDGTVIPLDAMASADDEGAFTYTLDTSGLPGGSYSLIAHGLNSDKEAVFSFTINGSTASTVHLSVEGDTTVAAGAVLTIQGASYEADEPIGFWINVPDGTSIPEDSLGQTNSYIDGTVIPLDAMASADDQGAFTYTLDTSGLPGGTYSLVAQGLNSDIVGVLSFTVK